MKKFGIKITGSAAALAAALPGDYCGEPLTLTDRSGATIYGLPAELSDVFDDGPITFAHSKLRAAKVQVDPQDLRADGQAAALWAGVLQGGGSPSLPDMPAGWVDAIARAA